MKYAAIGLLFLFNSEIISLLALTFMMMFFFGDILRERFF